MTDFAIGDKLEFSADKDIVHLFIGLTENDLIKTACSLQTAKELFKKVGQPVNCPFCLSNLSKLHERKRNLQKISRLSYGA